MPPRLAFAACTGHGNVASSKRSCFGNCLAAPATGHNWLGSAALRPTGNDDMGDSIEPKGLLRGSERCLLRADTQPVAGIFHIRPDRHLSVRPSDRAADMEMRIGSMRPSSRLPCKGNQFLDLAHLAISADWSIRRASQTSSRITGGTSTIDSTTLASAWPSSNSPIGRTP